MAKSKQKTREQMEEHLSRRLGSTVRNATQIKAIAERECRHAGCEPTRENVAAIAAALSAYDPADYVPEPMEDESDDASASSSTPSPG